MVTATAGVPPCAPETLTKVAAATGDTIRAALSGASATVEDATATCTGKGASYRVGLKGKVKAVLKSRFAKP